MGISVFLSYPRPHLKRQQDFIGALSDYLKQRGLAPRTLGVSDYDMHAPLRAIRRLLLESHGLITVAFRRLHVCEGVSRAGCDLEDTQESAVKDVWVTSPFCQIEPAMAFQIGLPVLIFREQNVIADGVLEKGVLGVYMPEFTVAQSADSYLHSPECSQLLGQWEGYVRAVVERKGRPPELY